MIDPRLACRQIRFERSAIRGPAYDSAEQRVKHGGDRDLRRRAFGHDVGRGVG